VGGDDPDDDVGLDTEFSLQHFVEMGQPSSLVVTDGFTSIYIYGWAFRGKPIISIVLPVSISSIEDGAFDQCTSLTSINLSNVSSIG
jgi:hypothetical protein